MFSLYTKNTKLPNFVAHADLRQYNVEFKMLKRNEDKLVKVPVVSEAVNLALRDVYRT